jgi:hypothetical protein
MRLNNWPVICRNRRRKWRNGCGQRCAVNSNRSNSCERCRKYHSLCDSYIADKATSVWAFGQ